MKISVLKVTAKGELILIWISPDVLELRRALGGPVDTINLFTDVQTFIRRTPNELEENVCVHGVSGDIVITGGHGSYLASLSAQQIYDLTRMFRKEKTSHGKTRLSY